MVLRRQKTFSSETRGFGSSAPSGGGMGATPLETPRKQLQVFNLKSNINLSNGAVLSPSPQTHFHVFNLSFANSFHAFLRVHTSVVNSNCCSEITRDTTRFVHHHHTPDEAQCWVSRSYAKGIEICSGLVKANGLQKHQRHFLWLNWMQESLNTQPLGRRLIFWGSSLRDRVSVMTLEGLERPLVVMTDE
ncbi:uncharacterized protein LOC131163489 [Malania oleifera]|uniref:uncharacterized protein LOC131163489 n=1 Tax=Malania oleifera TaxID=397392 RepID=UPI0025ADF5DE|nr:uncharacterized protein LOC131163489 [Malania oleifera]